MSDHKVTATNCPYSLMMVPLQVDSASIASNNSSINGVVAENSNSSQAQQKEASDAVKASVS